MQFHDFYDKTIVLSVVGYLRPELPFDDLEDTGLGGKGGERGGGMRA